MMNFFKRALISLQRNMGKTAILFILIFVLGNLIAGLVSVNKATNNVETMIKNKLGANASIDIDYEALAKAYPDHEWDAETMPKLPSTEELANFAKLDMVKSYDYTLYFNLASKELKPYVIGEGMEGLFYYDETKNEANFNIKGIQNPNLLAIEEDKVKLIDGRLMSKDEINSGKNVTIITKQLAEENGLSIGSELHLINNVYDWGGNDGKGEAQFLKSEPVPLNVVGIIDPMIIERDASEHADNIGGDMYYEDNSKANEILVPNALIDELNSFSVKVLEEAHPEEDPFPMDPYDTVQFILKSPEDTDAFRDAVQPHLQEFVVVHTSSDAYDQIAAPLVTMKKLSSIFLIVVVAATILILSLVTVLFIRDRKHEFGIYLSLGESRLKVIGQIVIETMIVGFLAICLSVVTGNMLARNVSDKLITMQLESEQMNQGDFYISGIDFGDVTQETAVDAFQVTITPGYVVSFYLVGLGTIFIATAVPTLYIIRLNPKKIMM